MPPTSAESLEDRIRFTSIEEVGTRAPVTEESGFDSNTEPIPLAKRVSSHVGLCWWSGRGTDSGKDSTRPREAPSMSAMSVQDLPPLTAGRTPRRHERHRPRPRGTAPRSRAPRRGRRRSRRRGGRVRRSAAAARGRPSADMLGASRGGVESFPESVRVDGARIRYLPTLLDTFFASGLGSALESNPDSTVRERGFQLLMEVNRMRSSRLSALVVGVALAFGRLCDGGWAAAPRRTPPRRRSRSATSTSPTSSRSSCWCARASRRRPRRTAPTSSCATRTSTPRRRSTAPRS